MKIYRVDQTKSTIKLFLSLLAIILLNIILCVSATPLTRLTNNDPLPIYCANDPYDFLNICYRNKVKEDGAECCENTSRMSAASFYQYANYGTDFFNTQEPCTCANSTDSGSACQITSTATEGNELGNLTGRWNVIGLFYDPYAQDSLFNAFGIDKNSNACLIKVSDPGNPSVVETTEDFLTNPNYSDPDKNFGFYSVPIQYRKYGTRFEIEFMLNYDITFKAQGGIVHITQNPRFIDLTCNATGSSCTVRDCTSTDDNCPPVSQVAATPETADVNTCPTGTCCIDWSNCGCKTLLIDNIMKRRDILAKALNYDFRAFSKTDIEDVELDFNWTHLCDINPESASWAKLIFMPFLSIGGTLPTASARDYRNPFSIPAGNNGHWSVGGRGGFVADFYNAMNIGAEVGVTGFMPKVHNYVPVPLKGAGQIGNEQSGINQQNATGDFQSGIYSQKGQLSIHPGLNTHFAAYIGAFHFLDKFSAYAQYIGVIHNNDEFYIPCGTKDAGQVNFLSQYFNLEKLSELSTWNSHMINMALNYDIAQWIQLGVTWQIPVSQRNAYRSSTILLALQGMF